MNRTNSYFFACIVRNRPQVYYLAGEPYRVTPDSSCLTFSRKLEVNSVQIRSNMKSIKHKKFRCFSLVLSSDVASSLQVFLSLACQKFVMSKFAPPEGVPVDQWFSSKYASSRRPIVVFADEFQLLREEKQRAPAAPPHLRRKDGEEQSEFLVKAHRVEGFKGCQYIACEGPKKASVCDFWRMIFEEKAGAILMLNRYDQLHPNAQKVKEGLEVIEYWPTSPGTVIEFAPWTIKCLSSETKHSYEQTATHDDEVTGNYSYRLCKLSVSNAATPTEHKTISHICYEKWADGYIPRPFEKVDSASATATRLVDVLRKELKSVHGPTVVHCHAGRGRTGVAIVLHICSARLLNRQMADVLDTVRKVREQRQGAVMNTWQYTYVNVALAELALQHMDNKMLPQLAKAKNAQQSAKIKLDAGKAIEGAWRDMADSLLEHIEKKGATVDG